ncbi:MAG: hypothetical protein WB771_02370 [Solirubrobacterales bacterium]
MNSGTPARRTVSVPAVIAGLVLAMLAIFPPSAGAVTFGTNLNRAANYNNHGYTANGQVTPGDCRIRPYQPPGYVFAGANTCTVTSSGSVSSPAESLTVPVTGTLTAVRVKAGPITGPMRVEVLRLLRAGTRSACCFSEAQTPAFTPAPNTITTVPVNIPVRSDKVPDPATGVYTDDFLALTVLEPGVPIPMNDTGDYSGATANSPLSGAWYPAFELGDERVDQSGFAGYQVLLQGDVSSSGQVTGGGVSPIGLASQLGFVRSKRRAVISLVCSLTTACDGRLRLLNGNPLTAAAAKKGKRKGRGKAKLYGKGGFSIPAGETKKVGVKLTKAGRKAIRRHKKLHLFAQIAIGSGASAQAVTDPITLKRAKRKRKR